MSLRQEIEEIVNRGRACKVYCKTNGEWKMTMHTGLLEYVDPAMA